MCGVIFVANDEDNEIQHELHFYPNIMKSHVLNELRLKMCIYAYTRY